MGKFKDKNYGTCLSFNGTSNKIETALWVASNDSYSMGAWFRSRNYKQTRQTIISNGNGVTGDANSRGLAIVLSGNSTTDGSLYLLDHNIAWVNLSTKVRDHKWHHIFVVLDASGHPSVYLDGVIIYSGPAVTVTDAKTKSLVGADNNGAGGFFYGLIDEVRFYSAILTASEVSEIYHGTEISTVPANWYKLDEGSGTTASDSGSSAKTGTITGATYSTDVVRGIRTKIP